MSTDTVKNWAFHSLRMGLRLDVQNMRLSARPRRRSEFHRSYIMIREVTGVTRIRMLYLQLLYRCNFACKHCFHGEMLKADDRYAPGEVNALLTHFRERYALQAVTFLGGEPLLYPDIVEVGRDARALGLGVEICTNGHIGFLDRLEGVAPYLAKLRVSLEGLRETNDHIRQRGSFASAFRTIAVARSFDVTVGATMTVTALNVGEVVPLARLLERYGVAELKLHCLRPVGNATGHPELFVVDETSYAGLHERIDAAELSIDVRYDAELAPDRQASQGPPGNGGHLERVEVDPRGGLTMSCKAVGRHAHAFRWDTTAQTVRYEPHSNDEGCRSSGGTRFGVEADDWSCGEDAGVFVSGVVDALLFLVEVP
ncbi:MAG: radical SAM protein, partial [Streptosporangiales bacterium]